MEEDLVGSSRENTLSPKLFNDKSNGSLSSADSDQSVTSSAGVIKKNKSIQDLFTSIKTESSVKLETKSVTDSLSSFLDWSKNRIKKPKK